MASERRKVVTAFAIAGFVVTWLILASTAAGIRLGLLPILLCPPSIFAIALEHASPIVGLISWTVIATVNTAVYAAVGYALSFTVRSSAPATKEH